MLTMTSYKPLLALCIGYFMVMLDIMAVNVAIPDMASSMHISLANLAWIVDAYTLTFASLLLSMGNISDRYGAKKVFQTRLFIFVLASFLCGIANNYQLLIFYRLLQGASAALLVPSSLSLVNSSYSDKAETAKAIGIWATLAGIAAASGPVIGAVLTSWFNWRAIFFINIPFGIIGLLLTKKWVKTPKNKNINHGFDFLGQVTGILTIAILAYGLIEVGSHGWVSPVVLTSSIVFVLSFILFVSIEWIVPQPMLPLNLFRSPDFSKSIIACCLFNLVFYGELFLLPMYFHHSRSYSILLSGLAVLPQMILASLGSYLSGRTINKFGTKHIMIAGVSLGVVGFVSLFFAIKYSYDYIFFVLPLLLISAGASYTMPAATVAVIRSVVEEQTGIASGVFTACRQIGSLIGVALFGTLLSIAASFDLGVQHAVLCASLLCACALLTVVLPVKGFKRQH